jgi:hypothetical protein
LDARYGRLFGNYLDGDGASLSIAAHHDGGPVRCRRPSDTVARIVAEYMRISLGNP